MVEIESLISLIHKRHELWIRMVEGYGCNRETAEDIVQDMYIKIHKCSPSQGSIMYSNDDINVYYVAKSLKSIFLDKKRKEKRSSDIIVDWEDFHLHFAADDLIDFDQTNEVIEKELDRQYWFDKKVFEIIDSGESISGLARKTGIPYYSLYNTYKKVKEYLKTFI